MFVILKNVLLHRNSKPFDQISNYAKYYKPLISQDERRAKLEKERFELVRKCIKSAIKNRRNLSTTDFKTIQTELRLSTNEYKNHVFNVFHHELRPPNDSLKCAKIFIDAYNIDNDNLSLKSHMIRLYAKKAAESNLTEEEEQDLINRCDELVAGEFHNLPDLSAIIVEGLCATKEWRKTLEFPNLTDSSLNVLARKALRDNDINLTWNLLHRIANLPKHYQNLKSRTFTSFAKYFSRNPASIPEVAEKLFTFCEGLKMLFIEPSIKPLSESLKRHGHHVKITKLDLSGVCNVCKSKLQEAEKVTDAEFKKLQAEFMNNVVKGNMNNIYMNTTLEEWQSFERVIKENGPFDIIMDGLNVAFGANNPELCNQGNGGRLQFPENFKKKTRPCSFTLANAVNQFVEEGKRVLVIGRKHMNRWPKMGYIHQMATVFLVDNISKDDIFLLYAAIHSGQNAYIVSNDYMRQHRNAIGNRYHELFKLWQQEHWYGFNVGPNKKLILVKPMQYKMHIHKVGDYWHIPFRPKESLEVNIWNSHELPEDWACIKFTT